MKRPGRKTGRSTAARGTASPRRGDLLLVDFEPTRGSEVRKSRPAIVVSNDLNNVHAPLLTVVPLTSNVSRVYPFEVLIAAGAGLDAESKAMANQIRTVSKERVLRRLGSVPAEVVERLERAMLLHLGIDCEALLDRGI